MVFPFFFCIPVVRNEAAVKLDHRLYNAAFLSSDPEAYRQLIVNSVFGSLPTDARQFGHNHLKS